MKLTHVALIAVATIGLSGCLPDSFYEDSNYYTPSYTPVYTPPATYNSGWSNPALYQSPVYIPGRPGAIPADTFTPTPRHPGTGTYYNDPANGPTQVERYNEQVLQRRCLQDAGDNFGRRLDCAAGGY